MYWSPKTRVAAVADLMLLNRFEQEAAEDIFSFILSNELQSTRPTFSYYSLFTEHFFQIEKLRIDHALKAHSTSHFTAIKSNLLCEQILAKYKSRKYLLPPLLQVILFATLRDEHNPSKVYVML